MLPARVAFNEPVGLSCGALPAGLTCGFEPAQVFPDQTGADTILTIRASAAAQAATTSITVTAVAGGTRHTTVVSVTVR